ncbi:MAG: hypothetical protein LBV32_08025 [Tannerellaceae bacterium]|jgi:hypothetical protein|nr:hypothetical protein [Tannerellaceae bacterium]
MKTRICLIKKMQACILVVLSMLIFSCDDGSNADGKDDFAALEAAFVDPPAAYRTMPFWVWNGLVTEAEIDRMLIELKEAGSGGAFAHPRPGMITEYLSDDWFKLFRYAVDKGKELGLEIWIYDENSYPSGFAGGHVPQEMPESYNQGQGLRLEKATMLPAATDKYYLVLAKDGDVWKDITASLDEYKGKKGDYYLYEKTYYRKTDWYGGYSYVDLLVPGVTEKFIDITMKGYENIAKDELGAGRTVPGVFTDEPNIVTSGGLRWTPDLFDVFQKQWGYDLRPLLPLLEEETGEWKKVRHNYMETLLQLFIDRWSKPWYAYTEANKLQWTGHYWEHGWPQMNDGPDNMAMYAWHQVPSIDMLFNQFNEVSPVAQFGNIRAVKEVRSAANQMGRERTLSETYGGGGWDETFKDFKRLGDWEYVLGVNFMNQHLSHMTLTGARKYDYPPVFTYHSPWFSNYKVLNDYFARLSLVMSKGVQRNEILVLEPNSTLWGYYSHTIRRNQPLTDIGTAFQAFVTLLEKGQVEYDLGSENIIKDQGRVEGGKLIVGQAPYSTVVIPPLNETLNKPTFELLRQFVAQGGRLITFAESDRIDGAINQELVSFMDQEPIIHESEANEAILKKYFASTKGFDIRFSQGNLFHHRRQYADGELIFIANSSMEEATAGSLTIKGKTLLEMDALNGQIYSYPSEAQGGMMTASFRIEPAGSLLLYSSYKTNRTYTVKPEEKVENVLTADGETVITRVKENALTIDFCDVTVKGQTTNNVHFSNAANIAYKAHGFANGNPWNSSVQYKRNILDRDNFTDGGFTATYRFTVNDDFDYSKMQLVTERPEFFKVTVNGNAVTAVPGKWWLDRSFGVYQMGGYVKKGVNTIRLNVTPMSIFAEIEPVYVLGDFAVVPEAKGWSISAPVNTLALGSWKAQKQPFYSWDMKYSKSYTLTDMAGTYLVQLGQWAGTVAEVYVNGVKAGIIGYDPYQLDVTPHLKEGINQIDVHVIGSLKNLLGPHYRNPAPGLASPGHWKNISEPIAGVDYQMMDYGLMEDFELLH